MAAAKIGRRPDASAGRPGSRVDEKDSREDARQSAKRASASGNAAKKWGLIREGERLSRELIAVCTDCEEELTFEEGAVAGACPKCGNDTFRVVS